MFLLTTPMLPTSEWWGFLGAGFLLGVAALVGEILDRKEHKKEIAAILAGQESHSKEHDVLAGGSIAILAKLSNVSAMESPDQIASAAIRKIEGIRSELNDYAAYFWRPPNDAEAKKLEHALREIGIHSVRFNHHENTDCGRLARHLAAIFVLADWQVSGPHTGIYGTLGASGIRVQGKETLDLPSSVADAIRQSINASCSAVTGLPTSEPVDVVVTIGPKGTVRSQLSRAERSVKE